MRVSPRVSRRARPAAPPGAAISRRAFLGALTTAPLAARVPFAKKPFWEKKPFPDWTDEETDQILTDSPWAQSMSIRFELSDPRDRPVFDFSQVGFPQGGGYPTGGGIPGPGWPGGGPTTGPSGYPGGQAPGPGSGRSTGQTVRSEAYLTVRWSSAMPIRQALLLDEYGAGDAIPAKELQGLEEPQSHYVVELFGLPAIAVHGQTSELEERMEKSATLIFNGSRYLSAETVRVPDYGEYLSVTMRFPRDVPVRLDDGQVEVHAAAGPIEFQRKFKLKAMVYDGRLEL